MLAGIICRQTLFTETSCDVFMKEHSPADHAMLWSVYEEAPVELVEALIGAWWALRNLRTVICTREMSEGSARQVLSKLQQ